jgi:uncharacterized protein (DUF2141 family)
MKHKVSIIYITQWRTNIKKFVFIVLLFSLFAGKIFANNITFTLEITGININEEQIHVKIYSNEEDYKKDIPYTSIVLESKSQSITHTFDITEGEYLIALFQDTNNNGNLDTNFLGFPKEPVGLSNYRSGIPGGFNKHKFTINNDSNRITINMGKV